MAGPRYAGAHPGIRRHDPPDTTNWSVSPMTRPGHDGDLRNLHKTRRRMPRSLSTHLECQINHAF
jgi:hypothetical protein